MKQRLSFFAAMMFMAASCAGASCIDKERSFRVIAAGKNGMHHYQNLAKTINSSKTVPENELKKALLPNGEGNMFNLFHALAYDEVGNCEEMEKYSQKINPQPLFDISKEAFLDVMDMWIRTGRYEEVIEQLPKQKTLKAGAEFHQRATYYVAMAKYLMSGIDDNDLAIAKNRYKKAKEIYKKRHPSNVLYDL